GRTRRPHDRPDRHRSLPAGRLRGPVQLLAPFHPHPQPRKPLRDGHHHGRHREPPRHRNRSRTPGRPLPPPCPAAAGHHSQTRLTHTPRTPTPHHRFCRLIPPPASPTATAASSSTGSSALAAPPKILTSTKSLPLPSSSPRMANAPLPSGRY